MKPLPTDRTVTFQQQYRKCGKASCKACTTGKGHGPYWYFYYRDNGKLKTGYIGKTLPDAIQEGV